MKKHGIAAAEAGLAFIASQAERSECRECETAGAVRFGRGEARQNPQGRERPCYLKLTFVPCSRAVTTTGVTAGPRTPPSAPYDSTSNEYRP